MKAADDEIVALRTETSRTFALPDGRLQARIYSSPVNYRDGDDTWQKNDTRLDDDGTGGGRNKAGAYRLDLPKDPAKKPVVVRAGNDSVGFQLQGAQGRLVRKSSTGTYPEALPGVDLEYQAADDGVKETLVLKSSQVPTSFTFDASPSKGLQLRKDENGGLSAVKPDGAASMRFSPPSVEDSSGAPGGFSESATSLELEGPDDSPTVTLRLDPKWLADPARVFPVRLDPSYDSFPTESTYLNSGSTGTNYSAATSLRLGVDTAAKRNNVLLKYDTSSIPRDVSVHNAYLFLDVTGSDANAGGKTFQAKAVTRGWAASLATWATYNGSNTWTTAGGDVTNTGLSSAVFAAGDNSLLLQPLGPVSDWVSGTTANNGLQLSSTSTTTGSSLTLAATTQSQPLYVDYSARTGDLPYYKYSTDTLTDRTALKVNLATGNLLLANDDHDQLGRFYNSREFDTTSFALPQGWTQSPGNDDLLYSDLSGTGMLQRGPTGSAVFWRTKPDGTFASAAGSGADLVANPDFSHTLTERSSGTAKRYEPEGMVSSKTDRNGNQTSYTYQSGTQWLTQVTDPAGRSTTLGYSCKLSSMSDNAGRSWSYGYDSTCDYLTSYTDPAGKVTTYGYNSAGLLSQIVTPAGRKTLITYDGSGRALTVKRVTNSSTNAGLTTTYAYSATGGGNGKTIVTDPNGKATTYFYDASSRVTKATDALGQSRSSTYNADNGVTTATDAMTTPGVTANAFDGDFRATSTTSPTGGVGSRTYAEAVGPVSSRVAHWQPRTASSSDGSISSLTYDGPGNVTRAQDTTGGPTGGVATNYTYNPPKPAAPTCGGLPGQVCTATDGRGKVTRYNYESDGDLANIDNPAPLGDQSATFDSLGRTATSTDGKGQVTGYSYDARDRVVQTRYVGTTTCTTSQISAGSCITTTYDGDGNVTSTVDQTGTTSYGYDPLGRETSRSLPSTGTTSLTYDNAGNVLSAIDSSGTTNYTYDAANQLTSLREPGGSCTAAPKDRCTTFGYNPNGVRTTTTYPTGTTPTVMSLTPDGSGRVGQIRAVTGSVVHSDLSYTYSRMVGTTATDGVMTRTRVDNQATGSAGKATTYGYDSLARLTSAVEKNAAGTQTAAWSYGYDASGNRTSATLSPAGTGGQTAFGYNDANQLTSRAGSSSGFSYDGNGDETAGVGVTTRTGGVWNAKDQLTSLTAGGTTVPFTYSGQGNGMRLDAAGTSFRNTALGITAQTTGGATTTFVRDPGGTLIATRIGSTSSYYLFDGLGSVVGLVGPTGSKVASYSYDPYGQTRTATASTPNPYRYTGGYLDASSGLYKLGIRYYDPTLGRFTQPDPTGQDPHYTYASNNPVNYVDPEGDVAFLAPLALAAVRYAVTRYGAAAAQRVATRYLGNSAARGALNRSLGRATSGQSQRMNVGQARLGLSTRVGSQVRENALRIDPGKYHLFLTGSP